MNAKEILQLGTGVGAGLLVYLFGASDALLVALFALVVMDYITGVLAAIVNQTLSSKIGFAGIAKKVLLLSVVALGNILDTATGAGGVLRNVVIGFYIANEALSLTENAARCGVPLPQKLMDTLVQLKNENTPKHS